MRSFKSAFSLLLLTVAACTDHKMPEPTRESLLTSGSWYVTEWNFVDIPRYNGPLPLLECKKDDYFTFTIDGKFTQNEGEKVCNEKEIGFKFIPGSDVKGGWHLSANQQKISFTYSGISIIGANYDYMSWYFFPPECIIVKLDQSTLIIEGTADINGDGIPDVHRYTFSKR